MRGTLVIAGGSLALAAFLLSVPVPYHSNAEGVLWLPEKALVRADANGFVERFLVAPGTRVLAGEPLIRLSDPELVFEQRRSAANVEELEAEYNAEFVKDQVKAQIVRDKLATERASLALARQRSAELVARARSSGIFVAPDKADMPGRYYKKGELLGYVIGKARPIARVVVTQSAVGQVRLDTDRIAVRLAQDPGVVYRGRVVREVPAGREELPSTALSAQEGGAIATDPRDPRNPKALQRVFQFDVQLEGNPGLNHFGQRVFVRFDHQNEPLGLQWYRSIRLLFLSSFNV